jgi:hypothetical protein
MADPWLTTLTALRQIDTDLTVWARALDLDLHAWALALYNQIATVGRIPISTIANTQPVMGVVVTDVVAANPDRRYLMIANNSAIPVFIRFAAGATVADLLLDIGGVWSTEGTQVIYTGVITGITAAGSATLNVLEG